MVLATTIQPAATDPSVEPNNEYPIEGSTDPSVASTIFFDQRLTSIKTCHIIVATIQGHTKWSGSMIQALKAHYYHRATNVNLVALAQAIHFAEGRDCIMIWIGLHNGWYNEETVSNIAKIQQLCHKNGIRLIFQISLSDEQKLNKKEFLKRMMISLCRTEHCSCRYKASLPHIRHTVYSNVSKIQSHPCSRPKNNEFKGRAKDLEKPLSEYFALFLERWLSSLGLHRVHLGVEGALLRQCLVPSQSGTVPIVCPKPCEADIHLSGRKPSRRNAPVDSCPQIAASAGTKSGMRGKNRAQQLPDSPLGKNREQSHLGSSSEGSSSVLDPSSTVEQPLPYEPNDAGSAPNKKADRVTFASDTLQCFPTDAKEREQNARR